MNLYFQLGILALLLTTCYNEFLHICILKAKYHTS